MRKGIEIDKLFKMLKITSNRYKLLLVFYEFMTGIHTKSQETYWCKNYAYNTNSLNYMQRIMHEVILVILALLQIVQ